MSGSANERLAHAFMARHPEDAARVVERASPADAAAILASLPARIAADVYRSLGPAPAAACVAVMPAEPFAAILEALPLDLARWAVRGLSESQRRAVFDRLSDDRRDRLLALLAYAEHAVGALADPLVLALPEDLTVAEAQRQLRRTRQHVFHYIYVVTREQMLVGTVGLPELLGARPKEMLANVMQRTVVRLDAHADLATVAVHPGWRDFDALPVVDAAGRLIGAVRHKTIRRMSLASEHAVMDTIVGLSELYWTGLSGILVSLTQGPANRSEDPDVA